MTTTLNGAWSAVSTASGTVYESGSAVVNGPVTLANGATLSVMSGATASGINTISGGIATVVVSGGGELLSSYIQNSYLSVNSGGLTSGNQFNSVPTWIYSGASSVDDTYFNGGYGVREVVVYSGGTLNDATISSGGYAYAYSGGAVADIVVSSGGSAVLASGTTSGYTAYTGGNVSSGTSVYSGLVLPTADGSVVQNTVPVLGGTWSAVNTASGTVYESGSAVVGGPVALAGGAILDVMSGATASGVNTISGGIATVIVSGGGELLNSYIQNGYVYVSSGGLTSGNQLNSDPTWIYSGASSVDDTYFNSGYDDNATYVFSGGTLNDATVTSGALANVYASASASDIAVSSGGSAVLASGTTSGYTAYTGGNVTSGTSVYSGLVLPTADGSVVQNTVPVLGGVWSAVNTASGTVYESGSTVVGGPVALAGGAILDVMSGATASGVNTISGGVATVVVSGGGELLSSYIQNGYVSVNSGGLTSGNQFNSDPTYLSAGASSVDDTYFNSGYGTDLTYVYSGGSLNDATISSGGYAYAYSGGAVSDIAVSSGGSAVLASGTTSGYTAYTGGNVTSGTSVYSGLVLPTADGSAVQNTVPVLGGVWSAVSTASGTVYESGSAVVGGPVALAGGAILDVMSGATASGVNTISGGVATVVVSSGGELLSSYIQNGIVYVSSGGLTSANQLNSDPTYISAGASSVDDTYFNSGYGNDATYVLSGGTLNDATVTSGALAYVYAGASASNVAVSSGSYAYINAQYGNGSGGSLTLPSSATTLKGIWSAVSTASGTVYESGSAVVNGPVTLAYGATLDVMSGATASGVNTISGGIATVVVSSGGELLSSYIQNGYVSVNSGGLTSGNQFNSDPTYISAGASSVDDSYFNSGYGTDAAYVSSGGTIVNPYISSGGYADVQSGGTVSSPTVTPGGILTVEAGGALEVCFLPGTLIRTPVGEEAVENLRIGDEVSVHDYRAGRALSRKVTWIGNQKVAIRPGLSDDEAGYPVRILKDAIGEGVPFKDLLITPEHCLFFEGRFVPARMLVNGRSIFYDRSITSYTYYHIETEPHSVIWADGTLTESYLDTGNRKNFGQHGVVATLAGATAKSWTEDAGAALEVSRDFVEPVFRAIEVRAVEAGLKSHAVAPALTEESDLHLVTDKGQLIRLVRESEGHVTFMIPAGVESVRIVSRASRPSDVIGPFVDDRRLFGVAVGEVLLYEGGSLRDITAHLTDGELQGWQALEWADTRWTAGDALLPLGERRADAMALLILQIKAAGPYVVEDHKDQAACAI